MPGKHSAEKLAARRSRAILRGFLKCSDVSTIAKRGVSCTSKDLVVENALRNADVRDVVYVNDPWAVQASPPSSGALICNTADEERSAVTVDRGVQGGNDSAGEGMVGTLQAYYCAALQLIEQQNSTIAVLSARLQSLECASPLWAPFWGTPQTDLSCDSVHNEKEPSTTDQIHNLAKSLPAAVDAEIAKRLPSMVSVERFAALEELVKQIGGAVAQEIDTNSKALRQELDALGDRCTQTFTTLLKKQLQQDAEILQLMSSVSEDASSRGDMHCQTLDGNVSPVVESSRHARSDCSRMREMTTSELLLAVDSVRRRLPHIIDPPRQPLMIRDCAHVDVPLSHTFELSNPDENDSNATSELHSEQDFPSLDKRDSFSTFERPPSQEEMDLLIASIAWQS